MDHSQPASTATTLRNQSRPGSIVEKKGLRSAPNSRPGSVINGNKGLGSANLGQGDPTAKDRAPAFVVVLCLFQSLAGLLFGFESGVISGLLQIGDYQRRFGTPDAISVSGFSVPTTRQSLIVSFMGLGALFGSLLAGGLSTRLGMKLAALISLVVFLAGVSVEVSSMHSWGQIVAGRWIAGYGIGSLSMLAPLYQAECSPRHLRGLITSTYQLCATIGILLANAVNYNTRHYSGALSWRLPLAVQMIVGFFVFVGTVLSPESPRYYVKHGKVDKARVNLAKLRGLSPGEPELEAELDELVRTQEAEKEMSDVSYLDCFRSEGHMRLRTMIGVVVQAGQQWSGINFFFSYGVKFFAASGISDSFQVQLILSAVNVASTFPGLWAVEHLGRRRTLFISAAIIGQVVSGAVATAYPDDKVAGQILIAFSCIFIFGFAAGVGPLGWVVGAEQATPRTAAYCTSFSTASNWINNFILAMITPYLTDAPYANLQAKITFVWAGAIVLFALFVFFFVRETAGLSLVQVDELYISGVPAWRSSSWTPFGGESKRNEKDNGNHIKLEQGQHVEVAGRDLD